MKKTGIERLFVVLCLVGAVSCGNDDGNGGPAAEQEAIVAGQVVSWNGTVADESFPASAVIGLYAFEGAFPQAGVPYIANERMEQQDGVFRSASKRSLRPGAGTLLAYSPYREQLFAEGESSARIEVSADQTKRADYLAADFMLATTPVKAAHRGNVEMQFRRMCAKVDLEIITLGSPTIEAVEKALLTIELLRSGEVDLARGVAVGTGEREPMHLHGNRIVSGNRLHGLSLIVVPQTVTASEAVVNVVLEGRTISATLGEEVVLRSGMQYTLSVRIGRDASDFVVSVEVTEREWTDGPDIGETLDPTDELLEPMADIDGNRYPVAKIGMQYWMAENLRTTRLRDGTPLVLMTDATEWGNNAATQTPAYCYQQNDAEHAAQFGALYNFYAVATDLLCPEGWHVPTKEEIEMLIDLLGGQNAAGEKLKSTSGWQGFNGRVEDAYQGTNASGFDGRPGGSREDDGTFYNFRKYGYWWSGTSLNDAQASGFYLYYNRPTAFQTTPQKRTGYSVRCIRYRK